MAAQRPPAQKLSLEARVSPQGALLAEEEVVGAQALPQAAVVAMEERAVVAEVVAPEVVVWQPASGAEVVAQEAVA